MAVSFDPAEAYRSMVTLSPRMFVASNHSHNIPLWQPVRAPSVRRLSATTTPSTAVLGGYHAEFRQQNERDQQQQPVHIASMWFEQQKQQHYGQNSSLFRRASIASAPPAYCDAVVVSPLFWSSRGTSIRPLPLNMLLPPLTEDDAADNMMMDGAAGAAVTTTGAARGVTPAASAGRRPKSVRFSPQQQVFIVPNDDVEPRQWLQQDDLDRQRLADKRLGAVVARDEEYQNAILFLMKSFKAEHYVGRQQLLDQVRVLLKQPEARGLEHRIAAVLKSKRIQGVQELLQHQRIIRRQARRQHQQQQHYRQQPGEGGRHFHQQLSYSSYHTESRQLRQASLKLSRGARQLAFRLAQSDRLAAKAVHEEEGTTSSSSTFQPDC